MKKKKQNKKKKEENPKREGGFRINTEDCLHFLWKFWDHGRFVGPITLSALLLPLCGPNLKAHSCFFSQPRENKPQNAQYLIKQKLYYLSKYLSYVKKYLNLIFF